jgi:ribonuclease R
MLTSKIVFRADIGLQGNIVKEQILELLQHHPTQSFSIREVMNRLDLPANQRAAIRRGLKDLLDEGKIQEFRNHHYGTGRPKRSVVGILSVTLRGVGYVAPEMPFGPEKAILRDVVITRQNMGDAIHGDRVEAHIVREHLGKPEGYIVRVLERRSPTLVGRFLHQKKGGIVLPREGRIDRNIQIPAAPKRDVLRDDDWVIVRITEWTPWPEPLYGRIEEILGAEGEPGMDVLLIVRDHGVVPQFPGEVEREAEAIPGDLALEEYEQRRDLRDGMIVTIDPERAKDFDDAVSLEPTPEGNYRLGVHIADVTHYVPEGGAIDREALERATSIYPVDRVIPMLPERLSSDLCSLRPDVDRPAMSVLIEIDPRGQILGYELFRSIIRSKYRLTYRQAQDLFEGAPAEQVAAFVGAHDMLRRMRDLAAILSTVRRERGSLDLDIPETEVLLDADNRVLDVRRAKRWDSHRLIEDFMILANEVVARHLTDQRLPAIYRIHESPDPEKFERLRPFLKAVGVRVPSVDGRVSHKVFQNLLDQLDRLNAGPILHTLVLRAMMRAVYSPTNIGHFGLASPHYCHFTSPIRRYPDLIVHRVLAEWLKGRRVPKETMERWRERFEEIARHSSEREERANEIERDAVRVKSLEYMRQYVGEEFPGTISGVAAYGFFVELDPYPVEGLVHVRDLKDDYYQYDEENLTLVGEGSGRRFRFGDKVTVLVTRVDLINLQMDLVLPEMADEVRGPRRLGAKAARGPRSGFKRGRQSKR